MLHRVDNEISNETQESLEIIMGAAMEIVRPICPRLNASERAMRTGKNNLTSMMRASHDYWPLSLWFHHLPQA